MRFDVVIIGGGLAGYTAALRLLEAGKSCALVCGGQSALHFSSGSFDFLHTLPDGTPIQHPKQALPELIRQAPQHPYALLGAEQTLSLAAESEMLLRSWGIAMSGSLAQGNHARLTPLGKLVPTWLSATDALTVKQAPEGTPLWPWKNAVLLSVESFLDCCPEIIEAQLATLGLTVTRRTFTIPELETLRNNPTEFRSINIARVLERKENLPLLIQKCKEAARAVPGGAECIILPACFGLHSAQLAQQLEMETGIPLRLIPTLPPSLLGARISRKLARIFLEKGGIAMPGDKAVGFELRSESNTISVSKLFTANHEDVALEADHYILATGGFFSRGLLARQNDIKETVFGLDLLQTPASREAWTAESVFAPHAYAGFGVKVDSSLRGSIDGKTLANVHIAGMVLGGFDPVWQGCGGGVALVTGLAAAHAALQATPAITPNVNQPAPEMGGQQ